MSNYNAQCSEDFKRIYDKVIELNPVDELAWHGKGELLQQLGRIDEAEVCHQKAQELGYQEPSGAAQNTICTWRKQKKY